MNRLLSRVGVRVTSVGLLVLGIVGGVYLGQDRVVQQQGAESNLAAQVDADEMQLLKERAGRHAAARAYRTQVENQAATKAAGEAKAAASKARKLEKAVIAHKAAMKAAAEAKAAEEKAKESDTDSDSAGSGSSGSTVSVGPIPGSCQEYSGNRATGCALLLNAGFAISQFPCLDKLFNKESGWNARAQNSGSGAYGIPQALPGSKMASSGSDWRTNPATQIKWGIGYIKGRYGSPCSAWSHSQAVGSY